MLAGMLLAAALLSPTDGPGPQSRALTTSELETVLRGTSIIDAYRPYSFCCYPEVFLRNGDYVRHEDNFEAHGSYRIKDNQVCTKAEEEEELCRRVIVDANGEYWIGRSQPRESMRRISIRRRN